MPYINISTSAKIEDKKKILDEISILVSSLTNKSKRFVMAKLETDSEMYFEDESPCCFIEIKSIGSLNDKIYISFEDVPASMWAWNGRTFG